MVCGIYHSYGRGFASDQTGCILEEGHTGPHEYTSTNGVVYNWESVICPDCSCGDDEDICVEYWRKQNDKE